MDKKKMTEKAVRIRSDIVMFCQEVPLELEEKVEELIPKMDKILEDIERIKK
ncbi:MAG: hypothetical protein IJ803_06045 [Oribacterium sp.]|nr:hypothetical protein [Oribacterium sp.]